MSEKNTTIIMHNAIRDGLLDIGYRESLLQENYSFADMFAQDQLLSVALGVFAQEPPSYRNACFGVVVPQHDGAEAIKQYRSLGAPQIFAVYPEAKEVFCWKMLAYDTPVFIEKIDASNIRAAINAHQADWQPESILRAKAIRFRSEPVQLDFFDVGLIPALDKEVYNKLDRLLNDVIAICEAIYQEHHSDVLDYKALFRLIFRLIAAKLLGDRQYPGNWLDTNVRAVIREVEKFYFQHTQPEAVLDDFPVQDAAWRKIRTAFSLRNLSVEALAYVYENTLVTPETRRELGTHATPPDLAEYIVQNLPLEELPVEERRIFEPFCGHAPFLTAALARLRTLLPLDMPTEQRHAYLIRMLSGMEIDSFACEIARNSLIVTDYPNPNGWKITNEDFFTSSQLEHYLAQASVVLCNPPYEDFKPEQRLLNPANRHANKVTEALHKILQNPPKMLGMVLPRVFLNGQSYREIHKQINRTYSNITLVEIPPVFNISEAETVLLLAHNLRNISSTRRSIVVEKQDYEQFIYTGQPTFQTEIPAKIEQDEDDNIIFWYSRLQRVWAALSGLPRLANIADIHRGIEYNIPIKGNEDKLFSNAPRDGFAQGLRDVTSDFEPYTCQSSIYLNMNPIFMRRQAYKLPWDKPKVIANAARLSRGHWLIAAAVDTMGLVCYQNFHGIWPRDEFVTVEVISALLNSPVTNAFLSTHRTSRHNQIRVLEQIPVPKLRRSQIQLITSLVREYTSYRELWRNDMPHTQYFENTCRGLLRQIDAELLKAYNLPMQLEQELIQFFEDYQRPGPVSITQLKPSPSKRLYTSIVRVEDIRNEGENKVVDAVVVSWNPHQTVHLPFSLLPEKIQDKLERDVRLLARVNLAAKDSEELIFEDIELAPESRNDRFA